MMDFGIFRLLAPWSLIPGLFAAAILLWLFRRSYRKARPFDFPWSELFIENPPQATSCPPPWLVVLIAAIISLTLAASLPEWSRLSGGPQRYVVLLEAGVESLSREEGPRRRFDLLVESLLDLVDEKPAGDEFMLIAAGLRPRESENWLQAADLRQALGRIEPGEAPTDWQAGFDLAEVHLGRGGGTLIVAAGTPKSHYHAWRQSTGMPERPRIFVRRGRSAPNVGIESIAVFQSPFTDTTGNVEVHVRLRAFGRDQRRRVRLMIDDKLFGETTVTVTRQQAVTVPIEGIPQAGELKVQLLPADDQPADDVARAMIPKPRKLDVGVVSANPNICEILARLPGINVRRLSGRPQDASPLPDVIVVDRREASAGGLPAVNRLLFAGQGQPVNTDLLGVNDKHALCKGVGHADFKFFKAWPCEVSDADVALVGAREDRGGLARGETFPLVWTRSVAGRREVHFGLDPFAFDYRKVRKMPLLLVNSVEWLAPLTVQPAAVQLGTPIEFPSDPEMTVKLVQSDRRESPADSRPQEIIERAGIYQVQHHGRAVWKFAANAPARPIRGEGGSRIERYLAGQSQSQYQQHRPADVIFWWAGLALLLLEMLLLATNVSWSGLLTFRWVGSCLEPVRRWREESRVKQQTDKALKDSQRKWSLTGENG